MSYDILSSLVANPKGKASVTLNPKNALLKIINDQRKKPTWVSVEKNGVNARPSGVPFFPLPNTNPPENMVILGSVVKRDFTDPEQYAEFLDMFEADVKSGRYDEHIDDWAKRCANRKTKKS